MMVPQSGLLRFDALWTAFSVLHYILSLSDTSNREAVLATYCDPSHIRALQHEVLSLPHVIIQRMLAFRLTICLSSDTPDQDV